MASKQVQSISLTIDNSSRDEKHRSKSQPHLTADHEYRPRAHSYSTQKKGIVSHSPMIIEESESRKTSFIKNPISRNNSASSKRGKIINLNGYDNGAFNGMNNSFSRGYIDSARSSVHDGLHVQREQYCCYSRWSPFERRLATSVGILAVVIVCLVIVVGFLAKPNDERQTIFLRP